MQASFNIIFYIMHKAYPKINRLGNEATEWILNYPILVQSKLDWANLSVRVEQWDLKIWSRTQTIYEYWKNTKWFRWAQNYITKHIGINRLLSNFPSYRLYWEWLCLSWDTIITKVSWWRWEIFWNCGWSWNNITLRDMYKYSKTPSKNWNKQSQWERQWFPSLWSLDFSDMLIKPRKMKSIISTWNKKVYEITTEKWFTIKATLEHKVFTNRWYIKLWDILIGTDCIAVTRLRNYKKTRNLWKWSRNILSNQRVFKIWKTCTQCWDNWYLELDHIDWDYSNNAESNRQCLCKPCHLKKTSSQKDSSIYCNWYEYNFDKIISLDFKWIEDCYDIEMEWDWDNANFVANWIVVHNCKHTIKYPDSAYNKFYMFDIYDHTYEEFLNPMRVVELAIEYDIEYPTIISDYRTRTIEELNKLAEDSKDFWVTGEGIVLKSTNFINKFWDFSYAKIVKPEFKEENSIVFWNINKQSKEDEFSSKFINEARVLKIVNKIEQNEERKIKIEDTPKVLWMVYHDVFTEELRDFVKRDTINFSDLHNKCSKRTRYLFHRFLNGWSDLIIN